MTSATPTWIRPDEYRAAISRTKLKVETLLRLLQQIEQRQNQHNVV
jgi:hypothetical protein